MQRPSRYRLVFVAPVQVALVVAALVVAAVAVEPVAAQGVQAAVGWVVEGEAVYEARDLLASWSGVAPLAAADLTFDPADPAALSLTVRVRPAAFDSGNPLRDLNARRTVFEVDDHPEATALATADPSAGPPRRVPGGWELPLAVDVTLHGVTVRYPAVALLERDGAAWTGAAALTLSLEAHGMRRPRLLGILTEDSVRLEVRVRARPAP